ncbi:MAG: hypothetical protein N3F07_01840 [Candidatus Micrarchaeota archaeon]|nr:hypothetical protein [Candidatus Micrarchaeota archaeon]
MQNPKHPRAVAVIAEGQQIGTLARRKINAFRKFLLHSEEYPPEVRKEWKEHRNKPKESLLMAYIHECGRLSREIEEAHERLKPELSRMESEASELSATIARLEAEAYRLKKSASKLFSQATASSQQHMAEEPEKVLEQLSKESERFRNVNSAIENLGRQLMAEAEGGKSELLSNFLSAFGKEIDEKFANAIANEISSLSGQIGHELMRRAVRIFMEMSPDYALIEGCRSILKDGTPFQIFSFHARREALEEDLEKVMRSSMPHADRVKAEELCKMVAYYEKNVRDSLKTIDYFISRAEEKSKHVRATIKSMNAPGAVIFSDNMREVSDEEAFFLVLRLEEEAKSLDLAISLAKKAKKILESVHLQQFSRIRSFAKYLELIDEIDVLENKAKSLSEKLASSGYIVAKSKSEALSRRLSQVRQAKERAQLALDRLAEKRKAEENLQRIRSNSADERLKRYLEKIESEEIQKSSDMFSFRPYFFRKEGSSPAASDQHQLCWEFVLSARSKFSDFLSKYPHMEAAFDKTLFSLAELFVESGFRLTRDKLTSAFKGRTRQQYLPNANASVVRLGMVGSNEYRFIIDISDSRQPIILMAGIKADSRRFMKRLVQGGYQSERSKAMQDGRASLFLLLSGSK